MEVLEAANAAAAGKAKGFVVGPQDFLSRGPFVDLCRNYGLVVAHLDSTLSLQDSVSEEHELPPRLYILSGEAQLSPEILSQSLALMQAGDVFLLLSDLAGRGRDVSTLRSMLEPLSCDPSALSPLGIKMKLTSLGYEVQQGVPQLLSQLSNGDLCHFSSALRILKLYAGAELSLRDVTRLVERMPDQDGAPCLQDLVNQRHGMLSERLEDIGSENLVGLFKAAAQELARVNYIATLLDDGKKPNVACSEVGVLDPHKAEYYLALARKLGRKRSASMISLAGSAVLELQRSPHDKLLVANYMAMRICQA